MKYHHYLVFLFALIAGLSTTNCDKDTVTIIDSVFVDNEVLSLAAIADASIFMEESDELYTDNGAGASDLLRIGYSDNQNTIARALVKFDISSLPANAVIVSATLSFTVGKSGNDPHPFMVHKLTQDWTEGDSDEGCEFALDGCTEPGTAANADVTWNAVSNGGAAWTTAGGTFSSAASATSINGAGVPFFTSEGLVADIESWRTTPASNFGWLLKIDEENLRHNGGELTRYYSREAASNKIRDDAPSGGADDATRPTLTIVYHL